jgi:hypothetical protein
VFSTESISGPMWYTNTSPFIVLSLESTLYTVYTHVPNIWWCSQLTWLLVPCAIEVQNLFWYSP